MSYMMRTSQNIGAQPVSIHSDEADAAICII